METEEVETLETTETDQELSNSDNETSETLSSFEKAFNLDAMRDEEETLAKQNEIANENETESENIEEETTNEETETENEVENSLTTFEFKSGDTLEKYDLSKEEDREKLKTYFEFGRHGSQKLGEINQKEAKLNGRESQLEASSDLILNQYLKNVVSGIEIVEKPDYDADYRDNLKYDTAEDAKEAYKNDKAKYEKIEELKSKFKQGEQEATKKYSELLNKFVDKNPEYKDKEKFNKLLSEDVQPIYNALTSMGSVPLPETFFEMIHLFKNKDKVIQDAITADRKKRLNNTNKVTQPIASGRTVSNQNGKELSPSDKKWKSAFNLDKYR